MIMVDPQCGIARPPSDVKGLFITYADNCTARGGRPTTSISSPSHILLIFSSEPPRNLRPFNIIF